MIKRIIHNLIHYGIICFGAIALILCLFFSYLYSTVWTEVFGEMKVMFHITDDTSKLIFIALLSVVWIACYGIFLRNTLYHDKTGRIYGPDHAKFGMTYGELVEYYRDADNKKLPEGELPVEEWKKAEGVILGKVGKKLVKRTSDGVGNLALFSLPGGGKTTSQIIPSAMRFNGSVLCVDIKGDVLNWVKSHTHRDILIFAPDNAKISRHFDPLAGIKSMDLTDRKSFVENLGYAIIPDETGDNAKFFVDGGRDFWNGIALYLLSKDINTSFMDIVNAILTEDPFEWITRIKDSDVYEAKVFLDSYYGANEKNISGQYKKVCESVRPFTNGDLAKLLKADRDGITPEDLEDGFDIYIEIPQDKIQMYAPITTIIVQNFMNYFMRRPDISTRERVRPVLMLLDEFPQLHFNIETLLSAMETLRSKRVSLFIAQQSLASLSRKYGEEGCREIIDNCAYISVMSAQDPKSREFFQKLIGTRKVLKIVRSGSSKAKGAGLSKSVQQAREPIYQPEDFGNLRDRVVIVANGRYIEADKCKCYQ